MNDAQKRQADADAIRHAARMIEAVAIVAETDDGRAVSALLGRHRDNLVHWLNEQADNIERAQP